jgi:hypothetical protein
LYKRGDPKRKLATNEEMIASLLGGTTSALATLPADVMVAQIQQAKKAGQRVSVVQMFKEQMASGGHSRRHRVCHSRLCGARRTRRLHHRAHENGRQRRLPIDLRRQAMM